MSEARPAFRPVLVLLLVISVVSLFPLPNQADELKADTNYWRVKATMPVSSPRSEKRSFTEGISTQVGVREIIEPESNMPASLKPNFRWSAFSGVAQFPQFAEASPEGLIPPSNPTRSTPSPTPVSASIGSESPSAMVTSSPAENELISESLVRLVFMLGIGLVVVTILMILVLIYVIKKFRKY